MELPLSVIESHITRGSILHSDIFEDIGHGKFFVIMGVSPDAVAGFFYVNSNINRAILNKPEQFAMQYMIKRCDYPFLSYDSYICASSLTVIPRAHLSKSMVAGSTRFIDTLHECDMTLLLEAVIMLSVAYNLVVETYLFVRGGHYY